MIITIDSRAASTYKKLIIRTKLNLNYRKVYQSSYLQALLDQSLQNNLVSPLDFIKPVLVSNELNNQDIVQVTKQN
jgi:hypothetical protein